MYIAGRLRTASIPPRTLIEVASYLCPPGLFAAGVSLSPMSRTSPQMLFGRLPRIRFTASGKACRAEVLDACLAHWPHFSKLLPSWDSKGFSALHPVRTMRMWRSLRFPRCGGCAAHHSLRLLWRGQRKRREFRPYKVPIRRNLEPIKFYSRVVGFTSEIGLPVGVYRTYFQ